MLNSTFKPIDISCQSTCVTRCNSFGYTMAFTSTHTDTETKTRQYHQTTTFFMFKFVEYNRLLFCRWFGAPNCSFVKELDELVGIDDINENYDDNVGVGIGIGIHSYITALSPTCIENDAHTPHKLPIFGGCALLFLRTRVCVFPSPN